MKQSIYQKLLLSLAIVAFLGTIASAQVINRTSVTSQLTEEKQEIIENSWTESELGQPENESGSTTTVKRVNVFEPLVRVSGVVKHNEKSRIRIPKASDNKNSIRITNIDKTSEAYQKKYKQDVIGKMNAADEGDDKNKYKAILESLK